QHSGDLLAPALRRQELNAGHHPAAPDLLHLADEKMLVGTRRDLRRVSDGKDLQAFGEPRTPDADGIGYRTADPGIDLVAGRRRRRSDEDLARYAFGSLELIESLAAVAQCLQFAFDLIPSRGEIIDGTFVLAGERAQRKQPLFGLFELARVENEGAPRLGDQP